MKYGDYFERESVPRWRLHNIDYNSLKLQIRLHTTKNQATAIAIPGHTDDALRKFEDSFYQELVNQHDRVDLFVADKADEVARRLRHLSGLVHSLLRKCSESCEVSTRRQRKLAKYQAEVNACGTDIRDLRRFIQAQVVAFRKILKKYKKWTGSTTLTARFKDNVLSNHKSFTRRDFKHLQLQYQELSSTIDAAAPSLGTAKSSANRNVSFSASNGVDFAPGAQTGARAPPTPPQARPEPQVYWNEYDHGSEAGDDEYYIECDPNEPDFFTGVSSFRKIIYSPVMTIRSMFSRSSDRISPERRSLLHDSPESPIDYFGTQTTTTDNEATEDEDASSTDYPTVGYATHYAALPSVEEQRVSLYREKVLHRSSIVAFVIAVVLLIVASVLVATGRHKLKLEVEAGVSFAVVTSLFAGCMDLAGMLYRHDKLSIMHQTAVWAAFITVCLLNGMLLVLLVGSRGL